MLTIRPCRYDDLDNLMLISHAVGRGMTSMPADRDAWLDKIHASETAFSEAGATQPTGTYFMVLEDSETGRIAGTTAIYTGIGLNKPFYSYKISTLVSSSDDLAITRQSRVLNMVNDYTGATEIGSLFLLPEFRKPGVGQFLSRARYLAIADFPERFGDLVMAELRGWQDDQGNSPLWDHLGHTFFGIGFQEAVNTAALKGTKFISDLMPRYPIYIDLLPQAARDVIGKPHESSAPALNMLKKEGFQFTGYVDLFDGGPSVQAATQEIHTVRDSRSMNIEILDTIDADAPLYMISNGQLSNYRVVLAPVQFSETSRPQISRQTAQALLVETNTLLRFAQTGKQATSSATQSQAA